MKLINSLYTIRSEYASGSGYGYVVRFNPEHFIYSAHFPGEPVTPGVCLLQMAAELLSCSVKEELDVECIKNVKFLHILVPQADQDVFVELGNVEMDGVNVKARVLVSAGENTIAKISIICRIIR